MAQSSTTHLFLLICVCFCAGPLSCGPREKPKESRSESPDGQASVRMEKLSKDEILDAANRAARQADLDPRECAVLYDEGNKLWSNAWPRLAADLADHDYQAVEYWKRQSVPVPSEPLWVLIDVRTGDVLKTVVGARGLPD